MAVNSSFFNSSNGDRIYQASNFAAYFASFIGNGVFPNPSTGLQVLQDADRIVRVASGKGWINGYYVENTDDFNIQIPASDGSLNRIDRIILGLNLTNRAITIYFKQGTPATNPVAPALIRNQLVHELALADVYVNRGATRITQANILDQRMNGNLCGIVSGVVNQVDTTTLYNQYETDFMEWSNQQRQDFEDFLQSIENALDGNTAGNLQNQIDLKANINSPSFAGTPFTPNVSVGTSTPQIANAKLVDDSIKSVTMNINPPSSNNNVWLKVGQVSSNPGANVTSKMNLLVSGVGTSAINSSDNAMVSLSSRLGAPTLRVQYLSENDAIDRNRAKFGFKVNNTTGQTELYIMLPPTPIQFNVVKLGVTSGTFDLTTFLSTEPEAIAYVIPKPLLDIDYVGNKNNLLTEDKTSLVSSVNELFTSVSDGKNGIAAAIASKGVPTQQGASFGELERNIRDIDTGVRYARGEIAISTVTGQFARVSPASGTQNRNYITISGLNFFPARIFIYDRLETYTVEFNGITRGSARSIIVSSASASNNFEIFSNSTLSAYVVNGGFRLPLSSLAVQGSSVYWEAYAL